MVDLVLSRNKDVMLSQKLVHDLLIVLFGLPWATVLHGVNGTLKNHHVNIFGCYCACTHRWKESTSNSMYTLKIKAGYGVHLKGGGNLY